MTHVTRPDATCKRSWVYSAPRFDDHMGAKDARDPEDPGEGDKKRGLRRSAPNGTHLPQPPRFIMTPP
jgi:hypothetical protein